MEADRVLIDELVLRLRGAKPAEARALATEVAERVGRGLAEAIPGGAPSRLELRIAPPPGLERGRLAEWIADRILRAVQR